MSGIIHINGKDYDEEGRLIKPAKSQPIFVDGIKPKSTNNTFTKSTLLQINNHKTDANKITTRSLQTPPTTKLQKSTTLNRIAVVKPSAFKPASHRSSSNILKNKKPASISNSKTHKHPDVVRSAKYPNPVSAVKNSAKSEENIFVPIKKTEEMIQAQLHAATAHLMTFKKPSFFHHAKKHINTMPKHHRRFMLSSSALAMILIIIGGLIYINLPGISIMVAGRRAGFTAYIPTFTPNGYTIKNPIGYTPGRVVVNFKSNTNDMKYAIEQKPTGWTSETLKEQVVSSSGNQYQAQYANGLTIFFTSEDTATWVDRGILFTLQGNSGLSVEQIAKIAASM